MSEFDKELLDVYIDMTEKYYELTNKLINIIKNQNSKINDAILIISISEKTKIKIRKILCNIGKEMEQICDLMIEENNK